MPREGCKPFYAGTSATTGSRPRGCAPEGGAGKGGAIPSAPPGRILFYILIRWFRYAPPPATFHQPFRLSLHCTRLNKRGGAEENREDRGGVFPVFLCGPPHFPSVSLRLKRPSNLCANDEHTRIRCLRPAAADSTRVACSTQESPPHRPHRTANAAAHFSLNPARVSTSYALPSPQKNFIPKS